MNFQNILGYCVNFIMFDYLIEQKTAAPGGGRWIFFKHMSKYAAGLEVCCGMCNIIVR